MSAAVVRALCCECGAVRTVSRNHHFRKDANRSWEDDFLHPGRGWRCTGTLKCSNCNSMTRHAALRDDEPPEYRDHAEIEERRAPDKSERPWRIAAERRSPEAVRGGRHPGSTCTLTAIDSHGNAIATAFQYPDCWQIDIECHGIRLAGMNPLSTNLFRGFCVVSEDEAHDWLQLFGALITAALRASW